MLPSSVPSVPEMRMRRSVNGTTMFSVWAHIAPFSKLVSTWPWSKVSFCELNRQMSARLPVSSRASSITRRSGGKSW